MSDARRIFPVWVSHDIVAQRPGQVRVASDLVRASPVAFSHATLQATRDCPRYPGLGNYKLGGNVKMDRQRFENIKERHGGYASRAVWADAGAKPKSNIGDLSVLDPSINPSLLSVIRDDVVMVGLNVSRSFAEPFRNFHDSSAKANDFKIRYAFKGAEYYGAYMTDIIKNVEMVRAADLLIT